ncbi:SUMF1/EgtB/PvdO family nonheme iron enzyme [Alsobacter sp. KACC 23698]|uniref:SUMF1/EgtB/PvdO family nonheme iron enzyme n=1 Tax=Alsobacter sp. KACC 23698 TaxID=3149229 RepID=A0AAU7JMG4_9HYPH
MLAIVKTKLALKVALLAAAPLAGATGLAHLPTAPSERPAVVMVAPGAFQYRVAGDFAVAGRTVNAPLRTYAFSKPLIVMQRQVSAAEFDRCVAAGGCDRRSGGEGGRPDLPAIGVSWQDATAYAAWFSRQTGEAWRLPTDVEWAYAAQERFHDDAVLGDDGTDSFTQRWLAKYEQESARPAFAEKAPRPIGGFGVNRRGLADLAGNVWEWTDTCFLRQGLDAAGEPTGPRTVNCGVRVVEGQHRAYVTDFVRDARAGGCSVGAPPTNLGFRLVRDDAGLVKALASRIRSWLSPRA